MADIRLAKPAAGTTQTVPSAPDGRFIFDFPADAATLTRNGDDLVLTFEDGAAIQLQGFYTTYSKEEMPSFQVDGVEISGQDFFAALDEDLMPAAGPASGSSAARGGRYNEYGGSDLLDGLDHLGRLDIGFDGGTQLATDTVEPSPYSEVDHGVTVTPSGVGAATEVVTVYEAGLEGGSQAGEKDAPTMARGSLSINAPDGVASIVIGGVVVFENGALTGKVVSTDEGTLSVTGYDPATGKLDFSYRLDRNTTEHVKSDPDTDTQISHTLVVTVTDTDGDSGSTTITVNVVDDAPTAVDDTVIGEEAQAQQGMIEGNVLKNDKTGADGLPNAVTSVKHGDEESMAGSALKGAYGELTLNADGTYTYKLDKNVDVEKGTSVTETFTYTITDADGDTSEATLTITIRGDEKEPVAPGEDKAEIVVDEGALSDGSGQHTEHGILGKDSFTVNLNGEDGTVTLNYGTGENASTITLSLINGDTFDENWLSENKTLTVNGVEVEVTGATQTEPGGPWKIEYTYELTGQQAHKNAGSAGAVGEKDPLSDSIDITVTDATGDMTTGSLMVTVHDDGPVLTDKIDFTVPKGKENYDDNSPEIMFTIGAQPYSIKLDDLTFGADVGDNDAPATLTVKVGEAEFTVMVTRDEDGKLHFSGDNGEGKILFTGPADADKEDSLSYDKETGIFTYTRPTADIGGTTNSYDVSLTITDADGDSDTVSDTYITVFRNPTVTDSTVTTDEGNIIMNDIPIGSGDENDKTSQVKNTAQGSITVNLDHADGTITIGDMPITVDKDGNILSVNGNTGGILDGQTIKGTYGYLSNISLVAQGDGTITINYTYTLNAPVNGGTNNVSGRGDSHLADQFTVTVTTQGGTETGTITANALDDAPVLAVSNPESVKDTADTIEIPLEKFSVGADVISLDRKTASISVEVGENEYTFTIIHESNGTYSFIAPNNQDDNLKIESTAEGGYKIVYTRAPQDIADGKDDSYTFDITVTDADGDTATGSVTVYAKVVPPTIDESGSTTDLLVDEDGLVHEPNSKTDAGQLVVDMHGQAGTVTIGGVQVTVDADGMVHLPDDEVADGIYGNLTITEASTTDGKTTIKYSYTLEKPYTDYVDDGNTTNTVENGDTFTVQVNGKDVASISVDIIDDVPVLEVTDTIETVESGATESSAAGKITFDFGADDTEGKGFTVSVEGKDVSTPFNENGSTAVVGKYGTLTINADGTYSYTANTNTEIAATLGSAFSENVTDKFTFTITDADGDTVSKTLDVTVSPAKTPEVSGFALVDEANLVDADEGNVTNVAKVTVADMFGQDSGYKIVGAQLPKGSSNSVSYEDGKLTYTLNGRTEGGKESMGLSDDESARQSEDTTTGESILVTVEDAAGNQFTVEVPVKVIDDVPTISVMDQASGAYGEKITGSVAIDFGADGADGEKSVTVSLGEETVTGVKKDGNYTFTFDDDSTLTLDGSTGNFSYDGVPASGTGTSYTFTFTVTDADGDTDTATTMVTITATDTTQLSGSVTSSDKDVAANTDGDTDNNRAHVVEVEDLPSGAQLAEGFYNGTYGTITVDASGNATYAQTGLFTHSGNGADTQSNADNVTVTVTLDDGSSVDMPVNVSIEDDVPTLTVKEPSVEDQKLPEDNLGSGKDVDFVFEDTATNTENAGNEVQEDILSQNNTAWENVTIYAAHVNYEKLNDDGYAIDDDGIQNKNNYHLEYSSYPNEGKNPADFGLMVRNEGMDFPQSQDGANGFETNAFVDANGNLTGSEAIVIDLGDKTAYGVSLDFGAFYSNFKGNEGQEHVLITFYKDDEPIGSRVIDAIQNEGGQAVVVHSDQFLSAGFDKVVISALQNTGGTGQASTFTLQGVGLITAPEPIRQVTGEITVASGADGYHAETGEDGTTTSNDFTQAHVRFDMPETLTIETEDGPVSVRLEVKTDSAGNSLLTGSNNGTEYFSVMLEQQRDGSWSWKMEQYQEFLVQGKDGQLGDLELGFITMDGDDDTATETVNIPLKNLPDLAVFQTTLVTDESYIDGLDSGTKPAEGGDSQANSAKASGTMSVNTYGKEGELILTIDGKEHSFSLDTGGKLFENQVLTVPTTYGQLTLQNDEAPGTIIYTYTQTKPYNHLSEDGPDQLAENAESFTVKVVDGGGNESGSATITVSIEDDAPVVTVKEGGSAQLKVTETGTAFMEASTLFDVNYGADGKNGNTSPKYELTYDTSKNPGLKAIVGGQEEEVTLQLGEDGILKGMAGETIIFTISVDESTGKVTLEMTGAGSLKHDGSNGQELHLEGVGVKVTVTDGDDDSTTSDSADLTLTITDDVPTISESQKAVIISSSEEDEDIADFDFGNAAQEDDAAWVPDWVDPQLPPEGDGQVWDHVWGRQENGYKELALNQDDHTITFSAAVVQYQGSDGTPIKHGAQDGDALSIKITDITDNIPEGKDPLLTFVSTAWNKGESGMAVYSGQRGLDDDKSDGEIGAINGQFKDDNTAWEAVKMDLGVDTAYSITITLNSFYNTQGDQEKAYIILMNDDKVVDKLLIEGQDAENGIVDSTKLSSAEAFNTVYIVPWGTKSDFLLNGVEVGYSPVTVLKSEGWVEAGSADGIKGYSFGYDQNDVVTVNEKNLTVSVEDDGKTIHFLSSSSDDDTYTKVIVGEATITEAGKWTLNWFDQETNPQQDTDFTLPIIATDGDDDTAEIKVKVVPSEDEVGDSQAADALPEEEEKQPAAEKREGKDGPQGMMDGALLQSSMAAEAAAPRMAAATLLGMALVADAADDVLAAATGTDGMPHADVKADGLSGDIGDAPSTLHMDGAAQSGADAFDATLDSSLFAPGVMDPLADGTESLEGLLPDKEHAPFDAEGLLFTAAAPDLSDDASGLVGKGVASGDVLPPAGEEGILGTEETDVLHGTDADDILRGGDGDELIFGGSGDDYIDGGEGRDTIYAGDGNDIIVYDQDDYLVSGGSGIDFMVSNDSELTLDTLLSGGKNGHEGPIVDSIEVLLKGEDALSLTSIQELADRYGIELGTNPAGQETLTLDMGKWTEQADGSYDFNGDADLTLETNLQHDSDASSDNGEMAQQVFILEHTNS